MKKIFALFIALITLSMVSVGQVKDDDQNFGNKRSINPHEKDFGKIVADTKVSYQFVIKAKKDFDLSIEDISAPDGINVAVLTKVITPETKNGGFTVTVDAATLGIGDFSKDVIVKISHINKSTGAKTTKEVKYKVKGIIEK